MKKYMPRIGWEKFECTESGVLISPENTAEMQSAFMFRWAFVVGWGERVLWAVAQPKDQMQRLKRED